MATFTHADLPECLQTRNGGMLQRAKYQGFVLSVRKDTRTRVNIWKIGKLTNGGVRPSDAKLEFVAELLKSGKSKSKIMREAHVGWLTVQNVEQELSASA